MALDHSLRTRWRLLREVRSADAVVVVRRTVGPVFRRLLRRAAKQMVYDFDDAVFLNNNGSMSPHRYRRFAGMVRIMDRVWAGNDYLAEAARRFNPRVITIPTSLDPAAYDAQPDKPARVIELVWIGSTSTRKYLEQAMPILELASAQVASLRLKIIADFDLPPSRLTTLAVPWSQRTEALELARSHIGIAPMTDDPWTRGKCACKVLQYMAARLPVVSSLSGANRQIVQHGRTGLLVNEPGQWVDAIAQLAGDAALRSAMGRAGRERVEREFSTHTSLKKMLADLTNDY